MRNICVPVLQKFLLNNNQLSPPLDTLTKQLESLLQPSRQNVIPEVIGIYDQLYPVIEKALWCADEFDGLLKQYQALFREQEMLIQQYGGDERYDFILSIPIADRPQHLRACLESIYQLCLLYSYGGISESRFDKIKVVIAEDSKHAENVQQNIELAKEYTEKGLVVIHFGQQEQYELLHKIPADKRRYLDSILTNQPRERFYLKGQAANRNLSYLKLVELTGNKNKTLYYFVDSDQSFQVNRHTLDGEQYVPALNYFYTINRVFSETQTTMLTGKLVGDPPVSPSVMAANFLDDVMAFFHQLTNLTSQQDCQFHQQTTELPGDAAYHDMSSLFGFEKKQSSFPYRCQITETHDNRRCLKEFSKRLNAFFFGEHLTRKTVFEYKDSYTRLTAARTIYPGNYIVNYSGLNYIIPFGDLRLRMSGPTAGRLIQGEIGSSFASFNMPMLHTRTLKDESAQDFRPGVEQQAEVVELSDEFERQFFGDLMLFTVVELSRQTDFKQPLQEFEVNLAINKIEAELLTLYQDKHEAVCRKNKLLEALVNDHRAWWNKTTESEEVMHQVQQFIRNIDLNFADQSKAFREIQSISHRAKRKQQIVQALLNYRQQRDVWDSLF